jgi:hypothetical protein
VTCHTADPEIQAGAHIIIIIIIITAADPLPDDLRTALNEINNGGPGAHWPDKSGNPKSDQRKIVSP